MTVAWSDVLMNVGILLGLSFLMLRAVLRFFD